MLLETWRLVKRSHVVRKFPVHSWFFVPSYSGSSRWLGSAGGVIPIETLCTGLEKEGEDTYHREYPRVSDAPSISRRLENTNIIDSSVGYAEPMLNMHKPPKLSFYKRELPSPPSIAFSSEQGQDIFQDALKEGMLKGFFSLIEQFRTQDEPSFCGLASVAMVLNSLAIDPRRPWKGSWRIFHEQMLDCCIPLEKVQKEGITMSQAACLAKCNGAEAQEFPFGSVSEEDFRDMVKESCSTSVYHIIVSYSRQHFLQTGDGHFSPIGGYSPTHDAVLILDTARFKYPPHWVPLPMLYQAMEYVDPTTQSPRGFLKVTAAPVLQSVLFALDVQQVSHWQASQVYLEETLQSLLQQRLEQIPVHDIMVDICMSLPDDMLHQVIASRISNPGCNQGACVQRDAVDTLLAEMKLFPLYNDLVTRSRTNTTNDEDGYENEKRLMYILMCQETIMNTAASLGWSEESIDELRGCLDFSSFKVIKHEVQYLQEQYKALDAQYAATSHDSL